MLFGCLLINFAIGNCQNFLKYKASPCFFIISVRKQNMFFVQPTNATCIVDISFIISVSWLGRLVFLVT